MGFKSSQVPNMFLKEFPIPPLLSPIIGGAKGEELYTSK
jgi:hypothetical protein